MRVDYTNGALKYNPCRYAGKQAIKRRSQMLDAAEHLIRQSGGVDFPMRALASTSEVSPATPYNFFVDK